MFYNTHLESSRTLRPSACSFLIAQGHTGFAGWYTGRIWQLTGGTHNPLNYCEIFIVYIYIYIYIYIHTHTHTHTIYKSGRCRVLENHTVT